MPENPSTSCDRPTDSQTDAAYNTSRGKKTDLHNSKWLHLAPGLYPGFVIILCVGFTRVIIFTLVPCIFAVRSNASTVYAMALCRCVCLSLIGVLSKGLNVSSPPYDSSDTPVFWCQRSWRNCNAVILKKYAKCMCGKLNSGAIFDKSRYISEMVQGIGTQLLWKANGNSHVLWRMSLSWMTSNYPKPPHFIHFAPPFIHP